MDPKSIVSANFTTPACWSPRWDSNPSCRDFKSLVSCLWTTGSYVPVFPGCHDVQLRHLPIRVLRRDNISYVAQRAGSLPITPLYSGIKEPLQNLFFTFLF
nr:MAG TPA: hypothetical protein [Caudoviricetes sp.]